jgi:predicted TIM-barrel fold metal-dependent hydrolase
MRQLGDDELSMLQPAEELTSRLPLPTQIVSSDEYFPEIQSQQQREVEQRLVARGDAMSAKLGMSRRRFFQSSAGMAAAFLAMNEVYGPLFDVGEAEAAVPELGLERARQLAHQTVFDCHTHFLRDDTRLTHFAHMRESVGKAGWNKSLVGTEQTLEDLKFQNYFKEVFLDSDTGVALITNSPSEIESDWFLTNDMVFQARERINQAAGSRRAMAHYTIFPGHDGWLEGIEHSATYRPEGYKGYTIGDNTNKHLARGWRLDDEKLMYPAYERMLKAGCNVLCVHKGLYAPSVEQKYPNLRQFVDVSDVGKAARDWPQMKFVVYHSGYRHVGGSPEEAMAEWNAIGRTSWVSDLAEIPAKYGVSNVYGDLGQLFAYTVVAQPRLAAAIMGTLIRGLGPDKILWGTDAVWTGSPQWQIEGLRRLEIPEDMQKKHRFAPLGPADGPVKRAIFSENGFRVFGYRSAELNRDDRLAQVKRKYLAEGADPSNLRYGYVRRALEETA